MTISSYLENLLDQCGGLNRYQALLIIGTLGAKLSPTWSTLMMSFAGVIPDWNCESSNLIDNNATSDRNTSSDITHKKCAINTTSCHNFRFDDNMVTIVSEWDLVCNKDWVSDTITTVQMAGLLVSGFLAGHLADAIGRKPTFFLSLVILMIFNLCAAFSVSWQMFAVFRFLIGLGCGCYLTVFYSFLIEYTPSKHRPLIMGIPSWALWAVVFAFMAKWLHNWKHLHFATAVMTVPWLLFWWIFPESFRWLAIHGKTEEAEKIISTMAKFNRRPIPDLTKLAYHVAEEVSHGTKKTYSFVDIFRTSNMLRITLLCAVGWISCGYGYYAISFGVESLSGDLYLNMFLLSFVDVPAQISTYFLLNCLGRKKTNIMFFVLAGVGGIIVGIIQVIDFITGDACGAGNAYFSGAPNVTCGFNRGSCCPVSSVWISHLVLLLDTPNKASLINGFALVSKLGVAAAWASLQIITAENYPTVVRNIGYGVHNSISRVGGMVAPQIVYLNKHLSGILYFLFGVLMLLTALSVTCVPETKGKVMPDNIKLEKEKYHTEMAETTKF